MNYHPFSVFWKGTEGYLRSTQGLTPDVSYGQMIFHSQHGRDDLAFSVLTTQYIFSLFLTQHRESLQFHGESIPVAVQVHYPETLTIHGQVLSFH